MNRPTNAPCWVVYTILGGEAGRVGTRFYMRNPTAADEVRRTGGGRTYKSYDGVFSARLVEPFTCEEDAVAAALLVDGGIDRYEANALWPMGMEPLNAFAQCKDTLR